MRLIESPAGKDANMEIIIVREDEIEVVNCPECGSDNVLTAPDTCSDCARWRQMMELA